MSTITPYDRLPILSTKLRFKKNYPYGTTHPLGLKYHPRIIPNGDVIKDDEQMFQLVCLPGIKIVQLSCSAYVNYHTAKTLAQALNRYVPCKKGKNSCILATGGTWDAPRELLGTPRYAKEVLGVTLPTNKGLIFSCLDEYGYNRKLLYHLEKKVGTREKFLSRRQNPVSYGDVHRLFLYGAGFDEKDFRFPPFGFETSGEETAKIWRQTLIKEVYPAVVVAHGIGTFPYHDAFNDFARFNTITGYMGIAGSTKLQNGNDTVPHGWPPMSLMFRNLAAAYSISEPELIFHQARVLSKECSNFVPKELSYYVGIDEWLDFTNNLEGKIEIAREVIGRMPTHAISQGLADLIHSGDLHIFAITGGHKASAFLNCLFKPASESNPASTLNFYGRVIVFVDEEASFLAEDFSDSFWQYEPDDTTKKLIETKCANDVIANEFWSERESNLQREKWPN